MAQVIVERYRRWFEYEKDCHAKVLASLRSVPETSHATPAFEKALTLLGHIIAARQLWLFRFGVSKERPRDFFPAGLSLAEAGAQLKEVESAWSEYLSRLDDAALERRFDYQSLEGPWFRSSIEDILTQLFGHSWYHRGQIAVLVRAAGGDPAVTDFVFWSREPIEP